MLFKPLRFNGREEYGKETNQNPKNLLHFSSIRGSMLSVKHLMRFILFSIFSFFAVFLWLQGLVP